MGQKLRNIGVEVNFDYADVNFATGEDGGEYYVDIPFIYTGWKPDKIVNYMKNNTRQDGVRYSNSDIKTVKNAINRLKTTGLIDQTY